MAPGNVILSFEIIPIGIPGEPGSPFNSNTSCKYKIYNFLHSDLDFIRTFMHHYCNRPWQGADRKNNPVSL